MSPLHRPSVWPWIFAVLVCAGCREGVGEPGDGSPADAANSSGDGAIDLGAGRDGSNARVTLGDPNRLLLLGTVVTPDQVIEGEVLVEDSKITCVGAGDTCAQSAAGATIIDTEGVIAPGLIDTHNHILFDIFDGSDWTPLKLYQNHNQWTTEARYTAMLDVKQCLANDSQGKPTWCANTPYGTTTGNLRCEMDKFGELKGLVAGTTSIVGLPGTGAGCFSTLAQSVDLTENGLGQNRIQTSALFPPSGSSGDGVCSNFTTNTTEAYLIHCGEGIDASSLAEFQTLGTLTTVDGCLYAPQTTITHGTAFTKTEFDTMAQHQMKLTWSPASNVFLYGATADIPTAIASGVTIALAPDWSMGGSVNILDEMRFADAWDDAHFGNVLAAKDLVLMTTANAAKALALDSQIGRIDVGYLADLAVFAGDRSKPYDTIVAARPADVTLVMVGGQVLYGDDILKAVGPTQPGCESVDICGVQKFLCVATTDSTNKLDQTYAQITSALGQALIDADAQTPADGWSFAPLAPLVDCP